MYLVYRIALGLGLLLSLPWWLLQMVRYGKYRAGLGERLGRVPERLKKDSRRSIWVHAVSVGEVMAATRLIKDLQARFPAYRVVISTTTSTGQKLARERFGSENVFYFPVDFAFAVRAYLQQLQPNLVILAETEFWPNFLRLVRQAGTRVAVVNARISDRSLPRYRQFRTWISLILENVDLFLAQTEEDARRLQEIGARSERVQVSGNLKFDATAPTEVPLLVALRAAISDSGAGPLLVCGSTVDDEEAMLVEAFRQVLGCFPTALMVLAPRHPERFPAVAGLLAASGVRFWQRSRWQRDSSDLGAGIFLLDSIGELGALYALADLAFVGGSLVPLGGHNVLEPAQHGVAIVVGPHTENFRDIVARFAEAQALRITTRETLAADLLALLSNDVERRQLGQRAADVLRNHAGATARTMAALEPLMQDTETAAAKAPGTAVSSRLEA